MLSMSASEGRRDYSLTPKSPQNADGTFMYDLRSNIYLMEIIFQVIDQIIKCNV